MGWKSTEYIKRSKAIELILARLYASDNEDLADALESFYGDDPNLDYYGNNFIVVNEDRKEL